MSFNNMDLADKRKMKFHGVFYGETTTRVADIPSSNSFDLASFLAALFFDNPYTPHILSYNDKGTDVFMPLSVSSTGIASEINVYFRDNVTKFHY
jgi:hypothetical protein